jgi:NAD-dependent SIR2 family protein deacetylase
LQKYSLPYPEAIFDINFYRKRPQAFVTLAHELWPGLKHSPTLTHSFLKLLSDKGLLLRNYTQNIDGLEHLAGLPTEKLIECHGHFRTASCVDCAKPAPAIAVKKTIVESKEAPLCKSCGGHVKPDIVFFGEKLPDRFYQLIQPDVRKADCLLILGTSLQVAPVSAIPQMVNCPRVLFNRELVLPQTTTKNKNKKNKDIYVEGDCDVAVEQLCELLGWQEQLKKQNAKTQIGGTKSEAEKTSDPGL